MRIINITETGKSSSFVFHDILYKAGIDKHNVDDIHSVALEHALAQEPSDIIIIEAHRSLDLAKRIVQQTQELAPDIPIFVLFHSESNPMSGNERAHLISECRLMGIAGFIDANDESQPAATRLLRAAGIEPKFDIKDVEISNIRVGDIRFNINERKAYPMHPGQSEDDHSGGMHPIQYGVHRSLFSARGAHQRMGRDFDASSNPKALFDLTAEEAKFIEILFSNQGAAVKVSNIIDKMYNGVFIPERHVIDTLHSTLLDKLSKCTKSPDAYVMYDSATDGYVLNDDTLSIEPSQDNDGIFDAEREIYGGIDPEEEMGGKFKPDDEWDREP